jgi:nitroreductase
MNVSEAVLNRSSIRSFTAREVNNSVIKDLLQKASRSPSGGNLQPWRIFVLNKSGMKNFLEFQRKWTGEEVAAYDIYPKNLKEPYRTARFQVGEQMYGLLDIGRDEKEKRIAQVMKNFEFFGAPAGIFCFIDTQMGPPQWSDLGMFLQTFMLLSYEIGIDTCAQEAWSMKQDSIRSFLGLDADNLTLFCGMAIGYRDENAKINQLKTERFPISEWANFIE